jgi:hypothetical protein
MLSSKPLDFSQKRPSQDVKPVALKAECSRIPSTPPSAAMMSTWVVSSPFSRRSSSFQLTL